MITFLSDFGTADYFVAAVKGVIYTMTPGAAVIDVTHHISPQDILSASFTLAACYREFPKGTIHLAVVDPGVGSPRRPLLLESGGYYFVGPDNGLFSFALADDREWKAYAANRKEKFRPAMTATFHGRDVFAPLAAHLENGVSIEELGERIQDPVRLGVSPALLDGHRATGTIIHIDRFGNCVTNLSYDEFPEPKAFEVNRIKVEAIVSYYSEVYDKNAVFAYPGSAGYWEFGVWQKSAAAEFGLTRGTSVTAVL